MFKSWITISLVVVISCSIHNRIEAVRNRPIDIAKRAAHIPNTRYSNPEKQQKKLLQELKNNASTQTLSPSNFDLVVTALAYGNTIMPIARNRQMLEQSHDLFYDVPGYQGLVGRIIQHAGVPNEEDHFRGALFELQKAIEIEEADSDEYVQAFNQKLIGEESNRVLREIDIVTNKRWIECKDIQEHKKLGDYKKQIASQQKLALLYNLTAKAPITYEVHFKSTVSEALLDWLDGKDIAYVCPPKN